MPATPTITAFESSPDRGQGLARDMRVRWALEEVGQPYDVRLLSFAAMKQPAHLALQPFGQIPTYEEGDLALFESGRDRAPHRRAPRRPAAGRRERPGARDHLDVRRAQHGGAADRRARDRQAPRARQALARASACRCSRTASATGWATLSARLGEADWLDGAFSAGDLLMVSVLRRLKGSGILEEYPNLAAYVARAEARPAFRRAFAAQLAVFTGNPADPLKTKGHAMAIAKNTICLWYDKDAEAAARFYAATFPDSAVSAVHRAPGDYPVRQGGRRAHRRVHRLPAFPASASTAARRSSTARPSPSRSPPTTRRRPTATGTRSSATAARRAPAAGARTAGASPGRSRRAS